MKIRSHKDLDTYKMAFDLYPTGHEHLAYA